MHLRIAWLSPAHTIGFTCERERPTCSRLGEGRIDNYSTRPLMSAGSKERIVVLALCVLAEANRFPHRNRALFPALFLDQVAELALHRFESVVDDFVERLV
jgi:hypothetical protein